MRRARFYERLLFIALAVVVGGCGISRDDVIVAEESVPIFHKMLNEGQFDAIYTAASDDLKKVSTRETFVKLLDLVRRKLGSPKASVKQGWKVNYSTSGMMVTLNYKTIYSNGEAKEEFVYQIQGGKALLAGYFVTSSLLLAQ